MGDLCLDQKKIKRDITENVNIKREMMETTKNNEIQEQEVIAVVNEVSSNYGCPVCGMDEWCGTDGCPRDPQ